MMIERPVNTIQEHIPEIMIKGFNSSDTKPPNHIRTSQMQGPRVGLVAFFTFHKHTDIPRMQ